MERVRHLVLGLAAIAAPLMAGACSGGDDQADETPASAIVTPSPVPTSDATAAAPEPEGTVVNRLALDVAACFNDYTLVDDESGDTTEITTEVDCRRPHLGEIYASDFHPGAAGDPFPGNTEMERWATAACYARFESFVGRQYELSELEIGVIRPTEESWSDPVGLHREILCYVRAPDGALLSGSMAATGI